MRNTLHPPRDPQGRSPLCRQHGFRLHPLNQVQVQIRLPGTGFSVEFLLIRRPMKQSGILPHTHPTRDGGTSIELLHRNSHSKRQRNQETRGSFGNLFSLIPQFNRYIVNFPYYGHSHFAEFPYYT